MFHSMLYIDEQSFVKDLASGVTKLCFLSHTYDRCICNYTTGIVVG
jgi:hypothetical protein